MVRKMQKGRILLVKAINFICTIKNTLRNFVAVGNRNYESFMLNLKYNAQHAN